MPQTLQVWKRQAGHRHILKENQRAGNGMYWDRIQYELITIHLVEYQFHVFVSFKLCSQMQEKMFKNKNVNTLRSTLDISSIQKNVLCKRAMFSLSSVFNLQAILTIFLE